MNRKLKLFIFINYLFISIIFNLNGLYAKQVRSNYKTEHALQCEHPSLRALVNKLRQISESNRVIDNALKGGAIAANITYDGMPFEAMWECTERRITIDGRTHPDEGEILRFLLFELTNAASQPKYEELYRLAKNRQINCDYYVQAVEKIEFENMIVTKDIIEMGVAKGLFPSTAKWTVIEDFLVHYKIQQLSGHSLFIAEEYQDITRSKKSSYRGTIKNLNRMSKKQKSSLIVCLYTDYFRAKNTLMSET